MGTGSLSGVDAGISKMKVSASQVGTPKVRALRIAVTVGALSKCLRWGKVR